MKRFNLQLEMLPCEDLNVAAEYQRLISPQRVKSISTEFDPHVCGSLHIGRRKDKSLWVVDGQHRLRGAEGAGYQHVPCVVFSSQGKVHEAKVFRDINSKNRRLTRLDIHAANLCSGEPDALDLEERVRSEGFEIAKGVYPKLQCLFVLYRLKESDKEVLGWALQRLTVFDGAEAWQKQWATKGLVLECLGLWYERHVEKFTDESNRRMERMMLGWSEDQWREIFGLSGQNRQKHSCDRLENAWTRCRIRTGKFAV